MPDACFSDVARRYGIAERVLFRWKHEANQAARKARSHPVIRTTTNYGSERRGASAMTLLPQRPVTSVDLAPP
jgi:transposase-like protein